MRRIAILLLLPICFIALIPSAFSQTCTPAGLYQGGPITDAFNFISNPGPADDTCWAHDLPRNLCDGRHLLHDLREYRYK